MAPTATTMPTMIAFRRVTMRRLRRGGDAPLFGAAGSGSFTGILEADVSEARRHTGQFAKRALSDAWSSDIVSGEP